MPAFCRQKCTHAANQFCQADGEEIISLYATWPCFGPCTSIPPQHKPLQEVHGRAVEQEGVQQYQG